MKRIRVLSLIAGIALGVVGRAHAADVKVIANNSVGASEISVDELKAVFLITKTSLGDGSAVEPVLAKSGPAHTTVLAYLGKTDATLTAYLRGLVFSGKASMPKACDSDAEVVAYVAKTKGAVGYISSNAPTPGTKTLTIK